MNEAFPITLLPGKYEPRGNVFTLDSWAHVGAYLRWAIQEFNGPKDTLPGFVPCPLVRGYRCEENTQPSSVLVLDCDKLTHGQFARVLSALPQIDSYLYTSPSDDPAREPRKARIVIRPDRPVAPAETWEVRRGLAKALGVEGDPKCEHASCFFYVGGQTPRQLWAFAPGLALSVDGVKAYVSDEDRAKKRAAEEARASGDVFELPDARDLTDLEIAACVEAFERFGVPGSKHATLFRLGSFAASRGWSQASTLDVAERLLDRWANVRDRRAGLKAVRDGAREKYLGPNGGAGFYGLLEVAAQAGLNTFNLRADLNQLPNPARDALARETDQLTQRFAAAR